MSETVHKHWGTGRCASLGKEVRLDLAPRPPNGFLSALTADDFELIRPHLRTIDLVAECVLVEVGETLRRAYLPHRGLISLAVNLACILAQNQTNSVAVAIAIALERCVAVLRERGVAVHVEVPLLDREPAFVVPDALRRVRRLEQRGRANEALQEYRRAVELRPSFSKARIDLGTILANTGDAKSAAEQFRKAATDADPAIRQQAAQSLAQLNSR